MQNILDRLYIIKLLHFIYDYIYHYLCIHFFNYNKLLLLNKN